MKSHISFFSFDGSGCISQRWLTAGATEEEQEIPKWVELVAVW
jgi:hypothetical protein